MGQGWERGWEDPDRRRERLPRIEDLPVAEHGYDREAVERAFDAFYRHAAQLDASLGALEAVSAFQRQAAELRADLRALRAASWGPTALRPAWTASYSTPRRRGGVSEALPRMAVEAVFIVLVAVGAALADLSTALVVALVLAAWAIVGLGELVIATARPRLRRAQAPAAETAPAPVVEASPLPAVGEDTEEALGPGPTEEPADAEPGEALEAVAAASVVAAEAKPRRRWFRRAQPAEDEVEPHEPPRHVRVLPVDEPAAADPWEQGPELPAADDAAPDLPAYEPEPEPVADEPEPEPVAEEPSVVEEPSGGEEAVAAEEPVAEAEPEPAPAPTPEPAAVHLVEPEPEPEASPETESEPEAQPDEPQAVAGGRRGRLRRGRR
jgi:hypothetical protein